MSADLPDRWEDEPWPLDDPIGSPFQPKTWSDTVKDVPQPNELADEAWEYAVEYGVSLEKALAHVQSRHAGPIPVPDPSTIHLQQARPITWGSYKGPPKINVLFLGGPHDGKWDPVKHDRDADYIQVAFERPVTMSRDDDDPIVRGPSIVIYRRHQPLDATGARWTFVYDGPNAYTFFYMGNPLPVSPTFDTKNEAWDWFREVLMEMPGEHFLRYSEIELEWTLPEEKT